MSKTHLQQENQAGTDNSIATNGHQRHYWYSISDGIRLLIHLRKSKLQCKKEDNTDYPIKGGEEWSSTRENRESIFVADPYYLDQFKTSFEDDVKTITGTHTLDEHGTKQEAKNNRWEVLPKLLIIPILVGQHWYSVRIEINYQNREVSILWDNPYGVLPTDLIDDLLPFLKSNIFILFQQHYNQNITAQEITFEDSLFKNLDQQRQENNGYDCGPITFSNIRDYCNTKKHNELYAGSYSSRHYTISLALHKKHETQMQGIRNRDSEIYREISGIALTENQDISILNYSSKYNEKNKQVFEKLSKKKKLSFKEVKSHLASVISIEEMNKAVENLDILKEKINESLNFLYSYDTNGFSLLHAAVCNKKLEIVQFLVGIDSKENVNLLCNIGRTPLHYACRHNYIEITELFLRYYPEWVNIQDRLNNTPLHLAAREKHLQIVELLCNEQINIDLNLLNNLLQTALYFAVENELIEISKTLLEGGADVNILCNHQATTPTPTVLFLTIQKRNIQLINLICDYNPDYKIKNHIGRSVFDLASYDPTFRDLLFNKSRIIEFTQNDLATTIIYKLITTLLYELKRKKWNEFPCPEIRNFLVNLDSLYLYINDVNRSVETITFTLSDQLRTFEQNTNNFYGSYLSDDSDDEKANDAPLEKQLINEINQNLIYANKYKNKTHMEKQMIRHTSNVYSDANINMALQQLNSEITAGKSYSETERMINNNFKVKFYVAQYRGIHYMTNKWGQTARRYHRIENEINHPQYSSSVLMGASNTKSYSELYKSKAKMNTEEKKILENKNGKWAFVLYQALKDMHLTGQYIYKRKKNDTIYTFNNLADLLQDVYTKDYHKFENLLKESLLLKQFLLNEFIPFVSTGDAPLHALQYAYGMKPYSGYEDERLRPRWNSLGKAERPYSGKVYVSLHPISDFDFDNLKHLVSMNNAGRVNVDAHKISERETTFSALIPEQRIFYHYVARYPSFHHQYKAIFYKKYGFTDREYSNFKDKIRILRPHLLEMKAFKKDLGEWLCMYHETRLIELARKQAIQKGGILIYRNEQGLFQFNSPYVHSQHIAAIHQQSTIAHDYHKYLSSIVNPQQMIPYTIYSFPKIDKGNNISPFNSFPFQDFISLVLNNNISSIENKLVPSQYFYSSFSFVGTPLDRITFLLHEAVNKDLHQMTSYLIKKGSLINARNSDGDTALHLAVRKKNVEIIQILIDLKANPNVPNNKNESPKDLALKEQFKEIYYLLLTNKEKDERGKSLKDKISNIKVEKKNTISFLCKEGDKLYQKGKNAKALKYFNQSMNLIGNSENESLRQIKKDILAKIKDIDEQLNLKQKNILSEFSSSFGKNHKTEKLFVQPITLLQNQNTKIQQAKADGNCGFRALLGGAYLQDKFDRFTQVVEPLLDQIGHNENIRHYIAQDIQACYQEYIAGGRALIGLPQSIQVLFESLKQKELTTGQNQEDQLKDFTSDLGIIADYLEYFKDNDSVWPHTQGILVAFAEMHNIEMHCYSADTIVEGKELPSPFYTNRNDLPLHNNYTSTVHVRFNGNHFDRIDESLVPEFQDSPLFHVERLNRERSLNLSSSANLGKK